MTMDAILVAHLLFALALGLHEILRPKPGRFDLLTVFHLVYIVGYPGAALLLALGRMGIPDPGLDGEERMAVFLCSVLFYLGFRLAYEVVLRRPEGGTASLRPPRPLPDAEARMLRRGLAVGAVLSAVLILAYAHEVGGLGAAVRLAGGLRAGYVERGEWSFLKRFFLLPVIGAQLAFALRLARPPRRRGLGLLLGILTVLGFLGLVLLAGRARILVALGGFALLHARIRRRWAWMPWLGGAALLWILLAYGKLFFNLMAVQPEAPLAELVRTTLDRSRAGPGRRTETLARETTHFQVSLEYAVAHLDRTDERLWFRDLPLAVVSLAPRRFLDLDLPDNITYLNTYRVHGVWAAITPPGLVAFAILNAGLWGLVLVPMALGTAGGLLERFFRNRPPDPLTDTAYVTLVTLLGYEVFQAHPVDFLGGSFVRILFLASVMLARRNPSRRRARRLDAESDIRDTGQMKDQRLAAGEGNGV